ncbi:SMI1/KNR4 family protein [Amycolatopsis sp. FDAARGOS 1241]|uniref:SMI1/KNR4 family protein n=1 Tax=Amycolatopsis sp. FDAARGOS 1241 TaxID=2778070 RepID=UPI001952282E|nr:SMI1/KNR4 family protein [Amycolatopsis sp. FDAARGOS 1241]QRP44230.1 SMI1/KNR4 family protein [Amycolatopsis sp. FDAARGOS 1241]
MDRDAYLETAIRDVLTGDEPTLDHRVGHAALLLATAGAGAAADRLATQWRSVTERPATRLADDAVRARAWAVLFEARGDRPQWADALTPLDLDAEEQAHQAFLTRQVSDLDGVFDGSPVAAVVGALAPGRSDRVRAALAEGDLPQWTELTANQEQPDVAALGATRNLARQLVHGADPLGLGAEWPDLCAGALVAALRERYPSTADSWPQLVAAIVRERGQVAPPPAADADIRAAETRLGTTLPEDYREFLHTADGLPADVAFPRLLRAEELRADGTVVIVSEPALVLLIATGHAVEVDLTLGSTAHVSFRALLERHLGLLEASR